MLCLGRPLEMRLWHSLICRRCADQIWVEDLPHDRCASTLSNVQSRKILLLRGMMELLRPESRQERDHLRYKIGLRALLSPVPSQYLGRTVARADFLPPPASILEEDLCRKTRVGSSSDRLSRRFATRASRVAAGRTLAPHLVPPQQQHNNNKQKATQTDRQTVLDWDTNPAGARPDD